MTQERTGIINADWFLLACFGMVFFYKGLSHSGNITDAAIDP